MMAKQRLLITIAVLLMLCGISLSGVQGMAPVLHARPNTNATSEVPNRSAVKGMVYNYSDQRPEGGVLVILDGGGWRLETVSEANGTFLFGPLGKGPARLKLRLPHGTVAVNDNMPVYTDGLNEVEVNMGFYWKGRAAPPVTLTLEKAQANASTGQNTLVWRVANGDSAQITGVTVDVRQPEGAKVISSSNGEVSGNDGQVVFSLGHINAGESATAQMVVIIPASAEGQSIQAILSYDQQMTSQTMEVPIGGGGGLMPTTGVNPAPETAIYLILAVGVAALIIMGLVGSWLFLRRLA